MPAAASRPATAADENALLCRILAHEHRTGCADRAVVGGLDGHLERLGRDAALTRLLAALPTGGYRSLSPAQRRGWIELARASLEDHPPGTPRGTPAPPAAAGATTAVPAAPPVAPALLPAPELLPLAEAGTALGPRQLALLARVGVETVADALRHYPFRYHDFSRTTPVAALREGDTHSVRGTVLRARATRTGRGMPVCEATIRDAAGDRLRVLWFRQPWMSKQLPEGAEVALAGAVRRYGRSLAMANPELQHLDGGAATAGLIPVYHTTRGLAQRTLREALATLVERFGGRLPDPLPAPLRRRHGLPAIAQTIRDVHHPPDPAARARAWRRLAFDELLTVLLGVLRQKRAWRGEATAPVIGRPPIVDAFLRSLPFALTAAQQRALDDVLGDLGRPQPMARLLQGDVGSGKTVVALAAMLGAVERGHQAVLMAPTEVLAEQHYRTLSALLSGGRRPPLDGLLSLPYLPGAVRTALLTGSMAARERREARAAIASGSAQLIVGTHALIQQGVAFRRLGLAVVDEQHRFGVMQRAALRQAGDDAGGGTRPHLLVMSATPIPRSIALTLFGDLDLSTIDELPPGRTPITTRWLPPIERGTAFAQVRAEVAAGRQAFVICPLVEGSKAVVSRAATEEYERLRREELAAIADRVELLHGRMPAREKDAVMQRFASGETAVLVSTAVVEVGIDVPNATVMVIEGADRFGLSQLHQFRGRVGRGAHPSTCFLLADDPTPEAEERLSLVERNADGFALAQADLDLRGPGELFGTRQAGSPGLRAGSLLDTRLIELTRGEAERLLADDPELRAPQHAALRTLVERAEAGIVAEAH